MEVFKPAVNPDSGPTVQGATTALDNVFNDGYRQTARKGINPNMKTYDLSWKNITIEDGAYDIIDFLEEHYEGKATFQWKPPWEGAIKFFKVEGMSIKPYSGKRFDIMANFKMAGA